MNDVARTPTRVHGIEALRLERDGLAVTVSIGMGPRILAFAGPDGRNVLAELPDARIELPGLPSYRMLGGHRLWHTPEVPSITYRPDDGPVRATEVPGGVDLVGAEDPVQGLRKRLRVTLSGGQLLVEQELLNTGSSPITTAPWAITQVPPRGEAWLPFPAAEVVSPYLPDRAIVLWPYSSLTDERLSLEDGLAVVRGVAASAGRVKIGVGRDRGWIAWRDGGTLLLLRADLAPGTYGDLGASAQCYSCGDFLELETLGPVVTLAPGEATLHHQAWRLLTVDPVAPRTSVLWEAALSAG